MPELQILSGTEKHFIHICLINNEGILLTALFCQLSKEMLLLFSSTLSMGEQKQRKHKKLAKFVRPAWAALGFIPACLVPKTPLNIKLHTFWKPLLFSFDHLSKARICTVLYEPLIDFFFSQGKGAGVHVPLGPPSIQSEEVRASISPKRKAQHKSVCKIVH